MSEQDWPVIKSGYALEAERLYEYQQRQEAAERATWIAPDYLPAGWAPPLVRHDTADILHNAG